MGFIPPKTPPKPDWMSGEDYRQKILKPEIQLLARLERQAGITAFFQRWWNDITGQKPPTT